VHVIYSGVDSRQRHSGGVADGVTAHCCTTTPPTRSAIRRRGRVLLLGARRRTDPGRLSRAARL